MGTPDLDPDNLDPNFCINAITPVMNALGWLYEIRRVKSGSWIINIQWMADYDGSVETNIFGFKHFTIYYADFTPAFLAVTAAAVNHIIPSPTTP